MSQGLSNLFSSFNTIIYYILPESDKTVPEDEPQRIFTFYYKRYFFGIDLELWNTSVMPVNASISTLLAQVVVTYVLLNIIFGES